MNYPIVIIPIVVGCVVQFVKFVLSIVRHKKVEIRYLFTSGHMPSSHSAFVVSLTAVVAHIDGVFSTTFAISFVFAYIVVYDAMKIRVNVGHNGKVVNMLVKEIPNINREKYPVLKERVGHKSIEILVGAVLGLILTVLLKILFDSL